MKRWILKHKPEFIGGAAGLVAGWCYWYFVGCASGTCAITSSPLNSSLYGAFSGGLLGSVLKTKEKKEIHEND